jgi:hypothetical protein
MSGANRDTWRPTLEGAARMAPEGPPPRVTAEEFRGKGRKAAMFPTPSASSYGTNQGGGMGRIGPVGPSLETMVRRGLWPTPKATDARGPGLPGPDNQREGGPSLSEAVKLWPTPTADRRSGLQSHGQNAILGGLNPMWVEALMGFPLGWTDLDT